MATLPANHRQYQQKQESRITKQLQDRTLTSVQKKALERELSAVQRTLGKEPTGQKLSVTPTSSYSTQRFVVTDPNKQQSYEVSKEEAKEIVRNQQKQTNITVTNYAEEKAQKERISYAFPISSVVGKEIERITPEGGLKQAALKGVFETTANVLEMPITAARVGKKVWFEQVPESIKQRGGKETFGLVSKGIYEGGIKKPFEYAKKNPLETGISVGTSMLLFWGAGFALGKGKAGFKAFDEKMIKTKYSSSLQREMGVPVGKEGFYTKGSVITRVERTSLFGKKTITSTPTEFKSIQKSSQTKIPNLYVTEAQTQAMVGGKPTAIKSKGYSTKVGGEIRALSQSEYLSILEGSVKEPKKLLYGRKLGTATKSKKIVETPSFETYASKGLSETGGSYNLKGGFSKILKKPKTNDFFTGGLSPTKGKGKTKPFTSALNEVSTVSKDIVGKTPKKTKAATPSKTLFKPTTSRSVRKVPSELIEVGYESIEVGLARKPKTEYREPQLTTVTESTLMGTKSKSMTGSLSKRKYSQKGLLQTPEMLKLTGIEQTPVLKITPMTKPTTSFKTIEKIKTPLIPYQPSI